MGGKRGNPVLWGREWFAAMTETKGDTGAKHLIGEHADAVCEVPMPDDAALKDVDTMEEMERRRAVNAPPSKPHAIGDLLFVEAQEERVGDVEDHVALAEFEAAAGAVIGALDGRAQRCRERALE